MKENIKVTNDNGFNVGLMCYDWHKTREVKPKNFVWLNEKEIFEIDSNTPYFKDGTLEIHDDEINEKLGYKQKNPNAITEVKIKKLFELPAKRLKEELSGVTEDFAKMKVHELAKKSNLDAAQLQVVNDITGKKIDISDINIDDEDEEDNLDKNDAIEKLIKGNFMKMKSELVKYTSTEDKDLIYEIANNMIKDLSNGKTKYISEFCGKTLNVE
jgi:hypothetical protein